MPQTRPPAVTVIAILNLVFGALWLLCGLASLGMQASGMQNMFMNMGNVNPGNNPQLAKQEEIRKQVMEFSGKMNSSPLEYASHLQYIVLSALLIISGIGLLKMAPWGRALALLYATLSILSNLALVIMMFVVSVPLVQEFADKLATQGQEAQMMAFFMKFGVYVGIALPAASLIYPAIVLILLLRPPVAAAFRSESVASAPPSAASEHIEEDDRWGRG